MAHDLPRTRRQVGPRAALGRVARTALRRAVSPALAAIALVAASRDAAAETLPYQLEIGPSVGYVARTADSGGPTYAPGVSEGLVMRASLVSWLRVSGRYLLAYHGVTIPPGSLGLAGAKYDHDNARVETLGGYLHPTLSPLPRTHFWGTVGIGWSVMEMPAVQVDPPKGPHLRPRRGVFQEVPLGVGGAFDVVPRWLTVSLDLLYAPPFSISGDLWDTDVYYDGAGRDVGGFPKPKMSTYALFAVCLAL